MLFCRFYSVGKLTQDDMILYLQTHALMYEYYRQAQEIVPVYIGRVLYAVFTSDAYKIVNTRYVFRLPSKTLKFKIYIFRSNIL